MSCTSQHCIHLGAATGTATATATATATTAYEKQSNMHFKSWPTRLEVTPTWPAPQTDVRCS